MKSLARFLLLVFVVLVIVGFVRGWFSIGTTNSPATDQVNVDLTIDKDKMRDDAAKVKSEARELKDKVVDKAKD